MNQIQNGIDKKSHQKKNLKLHIRFDVIIQMLDALEVNLHYTYFQNKTQTYYKSKKKK